MMAVSGLAAILWNVVVAQPGEALGVNHAPLQGQSEWICPSPVPPPPPTPPSPFPFADFTPMSHGTFCCDQSPCVNGHSSFLYQGADVSPAACAAKCLNGYNPDVCRFITTAGGGATSYCMNAQYCNSTDTFHGSNVTTWQRKTSPRPPPPPPPPTPSTAPLPSFSVIVPAEKRALIVNVSQPVYSGDAGAGMHGAGIPTDDHITWATQNMPWFECSDPDIETAWYFRMYSYHNHINQTTNDGYIVTEFYPHVPWASTHNTIPCAAGHHIHEGRWIRDPTVMRDYLRFWFFGGGSPEYYTFWVATSAWANFQIAGNCSLLSELYPSLVTNYWDKMYTPNFSEEYGCYWHQADREGEENSVGGDGCRPVSNSVMYSEAAALQNIATAIGNSTAAAEWGEQAAFWQQVVLGKLWSDDLDFFVTLTVPKPSSGQSIVNTRFNYSTSAEPSKPKGPTGTKVQETDPSGPGSQCPTKGMPQWPVGKQVTVREIMGLSSPWYFGVPPRNASFAKFVPAWSQLVDPQGFAAVWGPRTTELRAPCYNFTQFIPADKRHECNWNGPSWPFETAKVISGMASILIDYPAQDTVTKQGWMAQLLTYARQHTRGKVINGSAPWIGETMHPDTGEWLARLLMYGSGSALRDRGIWYNHSTFLDLILSGLFGFRAMGPTSFSLDPLGVGLDYFAVDNLRYHGKNLAIRWDATGKKYGVAGFAVLQDGSVVASAPQLQKLNVTLH